MRGSVNKIQCGAWCMGIFKTEIKANYYIMFWRVLDHLKLQIFVDHDTNERAGSIGNIGVPHGHIFTLSGRHIKIEIWWSLSK